MSALENCKFLFVDDEEDFAEKLLEIHNELAELNDKAAQLAERIAGNFEVLLG